MIDLSAHLLTGLPADIRRNLENEGICDLDALCQRSRESLLTDVPNIGEKKVEIIEEFLRTKGRMLRLDEAPVLPISFFRMIPTRISTSLDARERLGFSSRTARVGGWPGEACDRSAEDTGDYSDREGKGSMSMSVQRHLVVIPREDGGVEVYPLKEWLRQHPAEIPPGMDGKKSTSHQLRAGLCRQGWTMQETPTEVRLLKPGTGADIEIVDQVLGSEVEGVSESDEATTASFTLEYQLRDFLAGNLSTIGTVGGKRLRVYVDPTGRDGVEYPTATGPIDILAVDEDDNFFVFELKRANSPDRALGQLTRYMGWVRQTIGKDRDVSGVIVARTISENLRYGATVVPNVHLFEYQVRFDLHSAHDIGAK